MRVPTWDSCSARSRTAGLPPRELRACAAPSKGEGGVRPRWRVSFMKGWRPPLSMRRDSKCRRVPFKHRSNIPGRRGVGYDKLRLTLAFTVWVNPQRSAPPRGFFSADSQPTALSTAHQPPRGSSLQMVNGQPTALSSAPEPTPAASCARRTHQLIRPRPWHAQHVLVSVIKPLFPLLLLLLPCLL